MKRTLALLSLTIVLAATAFAQTTQPKTGCCSSCCQGMSGKSCCQGGGSDCCKGK